MQKGKSIQESGFSLLEVMIAITLFSMFIAAYISSEGHNLADSLLFKKDTVLSHLCKRKLDEIVLNPPPLNEALTISKDTGNFEEWGHDNFEYEIEYKKFSVPNLTKIQGQEEEEGDNQSGNSLQNKIFEIMKKNVERIVWQVKVTVKEKGTDFPFTLSATVINQNARVDISF